MRVIWHSSLAAQIEVNWPMQRDMAIAKEGAQKMGLCQNLTFTWILELNVTEQSSGFSSVAALSEVMA